MKPVSPLVQISSEALKGLIQLLQDDTVPINPVHICYQDYCITHPGGAGPKMLRQFTWTKADKTEPIALKLSNWDTKRGLIEPNSYLTVTRDSGSEMVGFSLSQLLQDSHHLYPGFRFGNGEGSKNRWFGRAREDPRNEADMKHLQEQLRSGWPEIVTHPELKCEWVKLDNISLSDVKPDVDPAIKIYGKHVFITEIFSAFLFAEKIRDQSLATAKTRPFLAVMQPLNQILYGPPGTGKTYSTLTRAYEIMEGHPAPTYEVARDLFQQRLHEQIEFITFHQSFTYEDFIQGIRPTVGDDGQMLFKLQNGIFYELAQRARRNWERSQPGHIAAITRIVPFEDVFASFIQPLAQEVHPLTIGMLWPGYSFTLTQLNQDNIWFKKNGQAGSIIHKQVLNTAFGSVKLGDKGGHNLNLATLKQLYDHGIETGGQGGLMSYYGPLVEVLKLHATTMPAAAPEPLKHYVLIVDEINRANISKVFGELLTLLEPDKRLGAPHALKVRLPSGEPGFGIPPNLYLIGTMNTADKSIALLDIALRRRFEFQALYPLYQLDGQPYPHANILQQLNAQIIQHKSRDFQIGHAYFLGAEPLSVILNQKVIPLLYEYFLNDEKKIKQVLTAAHIGHAADPVTGLISYLPPLPPAPLPAPVGTAELADQLHAN